MLAYLYTYQYSVIRTAKMDRSRADFTEMCFEKIFSSVQFNRNLSLTSDQNVWHNGWENGVIKAMFSS